MIKCFPKIVSLSRLFRFFIDFIFSFFSEIIPFAAHLIVQKWIDLGEHFKQISPDTSHKKSLLQLPTILDILKAL